MDALLFLAPRGTTLPTLPPGAEVVPLPRFTATRTGRIFYELFLMPRLVRRLARRAKSVDIRFFAPAYVAPPRLPCPVTLILYDLHVFTHPSFCTRANRLHYRWRIPKSVRIADAIELPSRLVLDHLRRLFPYAADKARVRPLALREQYGQRVTAEEKAAVRAKYGLPTRYVLFIGGPAPRKNLPAALEAWKTVRAERPTDHLDFVLVGECPAWSGGKAPEGVCVMGYADEADMPPLYAGAAALLYPSFDEGYGLPIAEARACGCPVVTSAATASEIAPDAFTCRSDAASVADALRAALS